MKFIVSTAVALATLGATANADIVTTWHDMALAAIRANKTAPPKASRILAILSTSIHDAVNGLAPVYDQYLPVESAPDIASVEAAASSAARTVLNSIYPQYQANFDLLHDAIMNGVPRAAGARRSGRKFGKRCANALVQDRATDGNDAVVAAPAYVGGDDWEPTLPSYAAYSLPQWAFVQPFTLPSGDHFRPAGPARIGEVEFQVQYDEVRALGALTGSTRTDDQTEIANFWADGSGTETPPGHWNAIAIDVAEGCATCSLADNARTFALMNLAMADAAIAAWDAKYEFHNWRPITAIRKTDDPDWLPLINTPSFPDYVSGHSTFSGAAATVLTSIFGDNFAFTTDSDGLPGVERSFSSFAAAADEAALSRLYGGIHFAAANNDGKILGIQIGQHVIDNFLKPLTPPSARHLRRV